MTRFLNFGRLGILLGALKLRCFITLTIGIIWSTAGYGVENASILKINTDMHTSSIFLTSTNSKNTHLLTANDNPEIKLWDLSDGSLVKTYHLPLDENNEALTIENILLSPNSTWILVQTKKTSNSETIFLMDARDGKIISSSLSLKTIDSLCFAPDDSQIGVTYNTTNTVDIFAIKNGSIVPVFSGTPEKQKTEERIIDGKKYIVTITTTSTLNKQSCKFKDARTLIVAGVTSVRKYEMISEQYRMTKNLEVEFGFNFFGPKIDTNSQGQTAISDDDVIYLYDRELNLNRKINVKDMKEGTDILDLKFSKQGQELLALVSNENQGRSLLQWDLKDRNSEPTSTRKANQFDVILPVKEALLNRGAGLSLASYNGETIFDRRSPNAIAMSQHNIALSENADTVLFAGTNNKNPNQSLFEFDINSLVMQTYGTGNSPLSGENKEKYHLPDRDIASFGIAFPSHNEGGGYVFNSSNVNPVENEGITLYGYKYAINKKLGIIAISHFFKDTVQVYDQKGSNVLNIQSPHAYSVNISNDGKWVVTANNDGTIKWFRFTDGKLQLTLYVDANNADWILWNPQGYYTASPNGDRLIAWVVNNEEGTKADAFSANQFRERFYKPDLIQQIIDTQDIVKAANALPGRNSITSTINALPPTISIRSPINGDIFNQSKVRFHYVTNIKDTDAPVTGVRVLIDGRPQNQRALVRLDPEANSVEVDLPERDVQVSLIADNKFGSSSPDTIDLVWQGTSNSFEIKPKLYVLAIGVSNYNDNAMNLLYPAKDARDFAKVMQRQKGSLYRDVVTKILPDATSDDVLDGLEWLGQQTTAQDVAMLFLAGHGLNDENGHYYFLPKDTDTDRLKRTAIAYYEIKNTLTSLAGKTIAFLDTCHSGNVMGGRRSLGDINQIVNDLTAAENGVVVFTSSTGRQYSLEDSKWQNGAFTKALVEGLSADNEFSRNGRITLNMLDLYISERVKELTGGRQTPTTSKPQTISDFPIAVTR